MSSEVIKPMLAGKWPGIEKIKFPVLVQPKLDGIRCLIKDGVALSRTFKPLPNVYIQSVLGNKWFEGLDGEIVVGDPTAEDAFRQTTHGVMSPGGVPKFTFHVFDMWNRPNLTYVQRQKILQAVVETSQTAQAAMGDSKLEMVTTKKAHFPDDLDAWEEFFVDKGYEGAILRGPDSLYKYGRGNATKGDLLKLKRFVDFEAIIVGMEQEMHNGNEATQDAFGRTERSSVKANKVGKGTLGAFVCKTLVGTQDGINVAGPTEFKVGTGFSAQERKDLWSARNLIGKIIKVKSFPVGVKDKPRHPVFLGFRDPIDIGDPA